MLSSVGFGVGLGCRYLRMCGDVGFLKFENFLDLVCGIGFVWNDLDLICMFV